VAAGPPAINYPLAGPEASRLPASRSTLSEITGNMLASHAALVTRNAKHFEEIASSLVNPWEA
jgi:hypothetical protein